MIGSDQFVYKVEIERLKTQHDIDSETIINPLFNYESKEYVKLKYSRSNSVLKVTVFDDQEKLVVFGGLTQDG